MDQVLVTSDGTLPDGLIENHFYFVLAPDPDYFYLYKDWGSFSCIFVDSGWDYRAIQCGDTGTGSHYILKNMDRDKFSANEFYRDIKITGVDITKDQILCDSPFNTIPTEGNYHGDFGFPFYTIVAFHGSDLPAPLAENTVYIAAKFEEDAGFVLYSDKLNYYLNTRIDITDSGSGEMWFSIVSRFTYMSQEEDDYHNVSYDTPFVQLRYLIKIIFSIIGIELDTTLIDGIVYHKFIYTEWSWSEVYLLTTMLYNINQQAPLKPNLIDSNTPDQELTFLQFIQSIFGKLGINLKYTGDYTYKLIPQKRDTDYLITPNLENYFVIPDDNKTDYSEDTIEASGGYIHSRFLAPPNAWGYVYDDQPTRDDGSGNIADDNYYQGDTSEYIASRVGTRYGAGINDIEWYNHLFLFLKKNIRQE